MTEIVKIWGIDVEIHKQEVLEKGLAVIADEISRDYKAVFPFFSAEDLKDYLKQNIVIGYWEDLRLLAEEKQKEVA